MAKRRTRIKSKVTVKDMGWNELAAEIRESRGDSVTVGVHGSEDARADGGIGNVALMAVHEFGSSRAGIPERSVLRLTADKNATKYGKLMTRLGAQVYAVKISVHQALELLGAAVASDMRRTISNTPGVWPALKPATIARREFGGQKPLLDRAELQRAIKHKVHA